MSMSRPNTVLKVPTLPEGQVIATYTSYLEAQKAVDYMADSRFAVEYVTIVGSDLKMVERVIGRLSYGRVALAGLASGAWFGLFVGLLLTLFGGTSGSAIGGVIITAIVLGAGFGMLFGVLSFAMSGRKRDFTSSSQIVASEYSILCAPEKAGEARQVLERFVAGVPPTGEPTGDAGTHKPVPPAPSGQPPVQPPYGQQPPVQPPYGQQPQQPTPGQPPVWPTPGQPAQGTQAPTGEQPAPTPPVRTPDPRFVTPSGAPRYGAMLSDFQNPPAAPPAEPAPAEPSAAEPTPTESAPTKPTPAEPTSAEPTAESADRGTDREDDAPRQG
ncbi:hypothetical protein CLV28_0327 [Sediminihabitans luteus]|uniref:General stress protein 17M-like domain-containing protein n=1 Tax=Sediminihabitans luteus TaxID=1138585 RepID=A0A2M9CYU6_9CELL|nr:YrzE family protein [Sediminihabitans luteus]PJJ77114.1 hypothetical protein CLV28_0327 [Sediminihabitans luteus]GIJ00366.1 hypothetical protein Slu03_27430 [Sediminihabitans luteus]